MEKENPDSLSLSSGKILRLFRWREGTRHISVARLSKVQPWKVRKVIKICTTIGSFVKLHYFQFAFLENCVNKKQKKSKKDQRNFCSNTLNTLWVLILRYDVHASFTKRIIKISSFPLLEILLKLKNVYIWQLQWSAIHFKYKFCFLSQSSKCQSMVIKSLNVWINWLENKNRFLGTKHSHNIYKLS